MTQQPAATPTPTDAAACRCCTGRDTGPLCRTCEQAWRHDLFPHDCARFSKQVSR